MSVDLPEDWHWRNSMKIVRFFQFDAKAAGFLMLVLMHARMWTLILAVFAMAFFWLLERKGLTFPSAMRAFRVWLIGQDRPSILSSSKRDLRDTGSL